MPDNLPPPIRLNGRGLREGGQAPVQQAAMAVHFQSAIGDMPFTEARAFPQGSFVPQSRFVSQHEDTRPGLMDAFLKTCQRWRLGEPDQLALLGYGTSAFLGNQILHGRMLNPPQDAKDRAAYVIGISVGLGALFNETVDAELRWLNTPNAKTNNKAPLRFMLEGPMARMIAVAHIVAVERGL